MTEPKSNKRNSSGLVVLVLLLVLTGCQTVTSSREVSGFETDKDSSQCISQKPNKSSRNKVSLEHYKDTNKRVPERSQRQDLTVVVAVSGGGYRAANFGLGAMLAMDSIATGDKSTLLSEVDYYSTVSGGGLAVAAHLSAKLGATREGKFKLRDELNHEDSRILASLRKSYFWRITGSLLNPINIFGPNSRGDSFQSLVDAQNLKPNLNGESYKMRDIFVLKDEQRTPVFPYWFPNATRFSDGSIFPFSPDMLLKNSVVSFRHDRKPFTLVEDCGLSLESYLETPLSLGVRTSMNFPPFIPATVLKSRQDNIDRKAGAKEKFNFIRLSDGGQSDNLGIYTALDILKFDRNRPSVKKNSNHKQLLIVIDAFNGNVSGFEAEDSAPGFLGATFRSPFLPLDAHRNRIDESLSSQKEITTSVVNSVERSTSTGVAISRIDSVVDKVRNIGTKLWINKRDQCSLIEAGYQATLSSLGFLNRETNIVPISSQIHECERYADDLAWLLNDAHQSIKLNERRIEKNRVIVFNLGQKLFKRNQHFVDAIRDLGKLQASLDAKFQDFRQNVISNLDALIEQENSIVIKKFFQEYISDIEVPSGDRKRVKDARESYEKKFSELGKLLNKARAVNVSRSQEEFLNSNVEDFKSALATTLGALEGYKFTGSSQEYVDSIIQYQNNLSSSDVVYNRTVSWIDSNARDLGIEERPELEKHRREASSNALSIAMETKINTASRDYFEQYREALRRAPVEIDLNSKLSDLGYLGSKYREDAKAKLDNASILKRFDQTLKKIGESSAELNRLLEDLPRTVLAQDQECLEISNLSNEIAAIQNELNREIQIGKKTELEPKLLTKAILKSLKSVRVSKSEIEKEFVDVRRSTHTLFSLMPNIVNRLELDVKNFLEHPSLSTFGCNI